MQLFNLTLIVILFAALAPLLALQHGCIRTGAFQRCYRFYLVAVGATFISRASWEGLPFLFSSSSLQTLLGFFFLFELFIGFILVRILLGLFQALRASHHWDHPDRPEETHSDDVPSPPPSGAGAPGESH